MDEKEIKDDKDDINCIKFIPIGNDSKIFATDELIDTDTIKQIKSMTENVAIQHARYMPDCHATSNVCVVGFTSKLTDKIVPSFIGGDIGCGILTYPLGKIEYPFTQKELKMMDVNIRNVIPMGFNDNFTIHSSPVITEKELNLLFSESKIDAEILLEQLKCNEYYKDLFKEQNDNKNQCEKDEEKEPNTYLNIPEYSVEWLETKCKRIFISYDKVLCSLGTLGHSNHYIEINKSKDDIYYVTIHTGSRAFGSKICDYHQGKIVKQKAFDWVRFNKEERKLKKLYKKDKVQYDQKLKQLEDELKEVEKNPVNFLTKDKAIEYYYDMIFATNYAKCNRRVILQEILKILNVPYDSKNIIESVHNYIDFSDFIVRKGSISAHKDQLCIVSLNMRDGILLCKGKGNDDWNFSCAHGAGRALSRNKANNMIKMSKFQADMSGIYSSSVVKECKDEAPDAYKDSNKIIEIIEYTVEIVDRLTPILNIKATT